MIGRRRDSSVAPHLYEPGDYGKRRMGGDRPYDAWWFMTPNGILGRLAMPEDSACHHDVEEHPDGTISVVRSPTNSNSILAQGSPLASDSYAPTQWHGWIDHGVWTVI